MSSSKIHTNRIVILGAGNVATHLALALKKSDQKITFIYNRTINSAKELALKVGADYSDKIHEIPADADIYIIAVKDDAIDDISRNLNIHNGIVVHTSGGISIDVFQKRFKNVGVFYPLQTFSKIRAIDFSEVPVFIEANNAETKKSLLHLAQSISKSVTEADSEKRKGIHLAAVFSCNFINHMFTIGSELMKKSDSSFDLLKPLILETVNKALELQPKNAQTGPAIRNDKTVQENHLKLLEEYPEFEKIYRFVSESIYKSHSKKEN
ncbi:MAG: DUF2520 domain-containing protein [Bacteroidales bacterium]|jgi:predicted short-subunit dehydrogenase-like oxidoreductase (DUF2520 family)|nr:DUF2520 domain-containing protein [Bacteroidales bacterium]